MVSICARNVSTAVDAKKPGMQWPAQQKMIEGGRPSFYLVTVERTVGAEERWSKCCSDDFADSLISETATRACGRPVRLSPRSPPLARAVWRLRGPDLATHYSRSPCGRLRKVV